MLTSNPSREHQNKWIRLQLSVHLRSPRSQAPLGVFRNEKHPSALRIPHAMHADASLLSANKITASRRNFVLAEREGFEPSIRFYPYGRLAIYWFQPLTHLSNDMLRVVLTREAVSGCPPRLKARRKHEAVHVFSTHPPLLGTLNS